MVSFEGLELSKSGSSVCVQHGSKRKALKIDIWLINLRESHGQGNAAAALFGGELVDATIKLRNIKSLEFHNSNWAVDGFACVGCVLAGLALSRVCSNNLSA